MMDRDEQRKLAREAGCQVPETTVSLPRAARPQIPCDPPVTPEPEQYTAAPGPPIATPAAPAYAPNLQVCCPAGNVSCPSGAVSTMPNGRPYSPAVTTMAVPTIYISVNWSEVGVNSNQLAYIGTLPGSAVSSCCGTVWSGGVVGGTIATTFSMYQLASFFQLTTAQASALIVLIINAAVESWSMASVIALSTLDCRWFNAAQSAACPDQAYAVSPVGGSVTVAAGTLSSYVSQADADAQALALAEASLECVWGNMETTARCSDTVSPGSQAQTDYLALEDSSPVNVFNVYQGMQPFTATQAVAGNTTNTYYGSAPYSLITTAVQTLLVTVPGGTYTSTLSLADANSMAAIAATAELSCFFTSYNAQNCPAGAAGVPADLISGVTGNTATVAPGWQKNTVSQAASDAAAAALAASLLDCYWVNTQQVASCPSVDVTLPDGSYAASPASSDSSKYYLDGQTYLGALVPAGQVQVRAADIPSSFEPGLPLYERAADYANFTALTLATSQADCVYCNVAVPPYCLPDGVSYSPSDLPLQPNGYEPLNPTTWSSDATLGVPPGQYCSSNDAQGAQDYANALGTVTYKPTAWAQPSTCPYENDAMAVDCVMAMVDNNGNPLPDTKLLSPRVSPPVNIPAGLVSIYISDVPPTYQPGALPNVRGKDYANLLAMLTARNMLDCFWENPPLNALCDPSISYGTWAPQGMDSSLQYAVWQWQQGSVGPTLTLGTGQMQPDTAGTVPLDVSYRSTGHRANPLTVLMGAVISRNSWDEMEELLQSLVQARLDCFWTNVRMQVVCGGDVSQVSAVFSDSTGSGPYAGAWRNDLTPDLYYRFGDGGIGTDSMRGTSNGCDPEWAQLVCVNGNYIRESEQFADLDTVQPFRDVVNDASVGSQSNPVVVPEGAFRDTTDPVNADTMALLFGTGQLDCWLYNKTISASCPPTCPYPPQSGVDPTTNIWATNAVTTVTFAPGSLPRDYVSALDADQQAEALASAQLQCIATNSAQSPTPCNDGEIMMQSVTIAKGTETAGDTCAANAAALAMANAMSNCQSPQDMDVYGHAFQMVPSGGGQGGGGGTCLFLNMLSRGSVIYDYSPDEEAATGDGGGHKTKFPVIWPPDYDPTKDPSSQDKAFTQQFTVCDEAKIVGTAHFDSDGGTLAFKSFDVVQHKPNYDVEAYGPPDGPQEYAQILIAEVIRYQPLDADGHPKGRSYLRLAQYVTSSLWLTEKFHNGLIWITLDDGPQPRLSSIPVGAHQVRCIWAWGRDNYVVRLDPGGCWDICFPAQRNWMQYDPDPKLLASNLGANLPLAGNAQDLALSCDAASGITAYVLAKATLNRYGKVLTSGTNTDGSSVKAPALYAVQGSPDVLQNELNKNVHYVPTVAPWSSEPTDSTKPSGVWVYEVFSLDGAASSNTDPNKATVDVTHTNVLDHYHEMPTCLSGSQTGAADENHVLNYLDHDTGDYHFRSIVGKSPISVSTSGDTIVVSLGGSGSGGSGSGGKGSGYSGGSGKSTAIVPASWSMPGYVDLYTFECPDVRFGDTQVVELGKRRFTRVWIDRKYLEVCEPGSVEISSVTTDCPRTVGVRMIRDKLIIDTGIWPWGRPKRAVISYTGIRKGFAGVRFIERGQQEFDANERFLNLNKP